MLSFHFEIMALNKSNINLVFLDPFLLHVSASKVSVTEEFLSDAYWMLQEQAIYICGCFQFWVYNPDVAWDK